MWIWIVVALAVAALLVAIALGLRAGRSRRLKETFGPEYDRTVSDAPTRREAEAELDARRKRRDRLEIRSLSPEARERYGREWDAVQARFVDEPAGSVRAADRLVEELMEDRGYPMEDFEGRAELVSVDHPTVVENYRRAHAVHLAYDRGEGDTEDLRRAMVHYRSLFAELLEPDADGVRPDARAREEVR